MRDLKKKASRFFNAPTPDEQAANGEFTGIFEDFDAGIQANNTEKKCTTSRLFKTFTNRVDPYEDEGLLPDPTVHNKHLSAERAECGEGSLTPRPGDTIAFPPLSDGCAGMETYSANLGAIDEDTIINNQNQPGSTSLEVIGQAAIVNNQGLSSSSDLAAITEDTPLIIKKSSFADLKRKSSRFFRSASSSSPSSSTTRALPRRNPSLTNKGQRVSISRPIPYTHPLAHTTPIPTPTPPPIPFIKAKGPPPPRPPRPTSLDEDTLALMKDSTARMVIPTHTPPRNTSSTSSSTTTTTTTSTMISRASIEARLGLPSGHSLPRNCSFGAPELGVRVNGPLPPFHSFGRASGGANVRSAEDGVEMGDRELGPIEMYDADREGDWVMERRVSAGAGGARGTLWRDRSGRFHFVADI